MRINVVPQANTTVVEVLTGPRGATGVAGPTGSLSAANELTVSGSIYVSGSIIPNVPAGGTTSSFSLGSETAAWKDIYVSQGSLKFVVVGQATSSIVSISATTNGISVNNGPSITSTGFSGSISVSGSMLNNGVYMTPQTVTSDFTIPSDTNALLIGPDVGLNNTASIGENSVLTVLGDIVYPNDISVNSITLNLTTLVQATDDAQAAAKGVAIGGLYRNGNLIQIRLV